jgi:steroid 5-alpha reductase family enzyme
VILLGAWALLVACSVMAAAFVLARRLDNFSIVDVAWAFNFTAIVAAFAMFGSGTAARRLTLMVVVSLWSLRLAGHLAARIRALHPVEEGRYLELRRKWSSDLNRSFLGFFLFQGVLNAVLSLPFMFVSENRSNAPSFLEMTGLALFVTGFVGEGLADAQLSAFKRDASSHGQVFRGGLWRYSRHPNYFFEWLVWCGFACAASAAPGGPVSWVCPALMLYFLLGVTGIKPTEANALRSRGAAYRDYQATTSAFVPWPPRRMPERSSAQSR